MATKTNICNMAIAHLGTSKAIGNIDTDTSVEGITCKLFYDEARKATLKDFPWDFATKEAALGLVEELDDQEWDYSYRYPSDCIQMRRIKSGIRNDHRQSIVPYKLIRDNTGLLIYSDEENAEAEYTEDIDAASFFPSDFVLAFSYRLAYFLAPTLARGDTGLKREMIQYYKMEIAQAQANALNEEKLDEEPGSEFERSRM